MLIFVCLITQKGFASYECERNLVANILRLQEVEMAVHDIDSRLEKGIKKELAQNLDSKNSIYFHSHQIAELVCESINIEVKKEG
jgi:hypothetical protein